MNRTDYFDTVYSELAAAVTDPDLAVQWIRPWAAGQHSRVTPRSVGTGKAYRGMNRWWFGTRCYSSPWWLTFRQAKKLGGNVRKGEKSTVGMYYQVVEKKDDAGKRECFPIFKTFRVFNVEQCDLPQEALDRLAERLDAICPADAERTAQEAVTEAETTTIGWIKGESIGFAHGGDKAYYAPLTDSIQMPEKTAFDSPEAYAQTLAHEAVHATGHSSRLDRGLLRPAAFGGDRYGREELVAELGSCMVLGSCGVDFGRDQAVAYLRGWLRSCVKADGSKDPAALAWASGRAQAAADLILGVEADAGDTDPE